jgi:hypothetical protein
VSADLIKQLAHAVYESNADGYAVSRLQRVVVGMDDVALLLHVASEYPTTEEVVEVLARRAVELAPRSERAWELLASAYDLYDGQWLNERTRIALDRLLQINPHNLVGLRISLLHAKECGDLARAGEIAEAMLRVDKLNFAATAAHAKLLAYAGDTNRALRVVDRFIETMEARSGDDAREQVRLMRLRREDIEAGRYLDGVWP